jgi:3'-5' exoribonuclease
LDNKQFQIHPAALTKHHTWKGGLLQHTKEVVIFAQRTVAVMSVEKEINRDVLLTACVWHDFGKIYDIGYESTVDKPNNDIDENWDLPYNIDPVNLPHKKLIYHVSRSYAEWMIASNGILTNEERDLVGHCILSHHGRIEWQTVKEPITREAYILHHADMMSVFALHNSHCKH